LQFQKSCLSNGGRKAVRRRSWDSFNTFREYLQASNQCCRRGASAFAKQADNNLKRLASDAATFPARKVAKKFSPQFKHAAYTAHNSLTEK
jgi:hypothetical protein